MRRSKATSTAEPRTLPPAPRFTFVGGKGGVGKTTCAAAMAVRSAERGAETLVISTDPAPSLGDVLRQRFGGTPRPVRALRRLHAVEIDSGAALDRWLGRRRATLEEITLRGTWLDREDVSRLLRLALPGIDEIAALLQIGELAADARYDTVIVDTAPTGHLLRMLEMPSLLGALAKVFDRMQMKHRIVVDALRGGWTPDAADALIESLRDDAERLGGLLRDPVRARMWWITLPEEMAVEETADAIEALDGRGLAVASVLVNRITRAPPGPCRWCSGRRVVESAAIARLCRVTGPSVPVVAIPALQPEPRGVRALAALGAFIVRPRVVPLAARRNAPARITAALHANGATPVSLTAIAPPGVRWLMFGGKGGVGKTTCAAAVALELAAASDIRRVLLLSADPAHSLSDAFGQEFTDVPQPVPRGPQNLLVREVDADRAYEHLRTRLVAATEELPADRQTLHDLLELSPPGLDELVAVLEVAEAVAGSTGATDDVVVMDTAPTGHALRLLEMPALVHEWVKALMAVLLKYQPVAGAGELGSLLLGLSQGLGRLRALMADSSRTRFVVVGRAAILPSAETVRLLRRLRTARIDAPLVVVNAVGQGTCARCERESRAQQREIARLHAGMLDADIRDVEVVLAPAEVPPPHGAGRLSHWRTTWRRRARQHAGRGPKRAR